MNPQDIEDLLDTVDDRETNFPTSGDDSKISLRNSKYERFPVEDAQDLKDNFLSVWREGGNIRGNRQFELLAPIARRGGSTESVAEENAVKRREAWAARHFKDYSLAGVVAQVKWLVVGSRGLDHMRSVISEAKKKLEDKLFENPCWSGYEAFGLKPDGTPNCVPVKLDKITPNPCWSGYEAIGLKPNGDPNCVPVKMAKLYELKEDALMRMKLFLHI